MLLGISKESRKYTTFYGPDGKYYRYKRMTFGFVNAPAYWARYLQSVLRGLEGKCIIYVDDVLIFGSTVEEHLRNVEEVFNALERARIPIRTAKLHLLRTSIDFLGGIVSAGGLFEPNTDSVNAITGCSAPHNVKELKAFLGVVEWIVKHLGDEAGRHTRPLYDLLHAGAKWR